ncbi:kelch-like protein 28 [Saccostrea cucullata]|uniref:kelch-like protein 28 n=1 Tax=Saccostrea cuccullata TaxID=36930 RepID=UPI002ED5781E
MNNKVSLPQSSNSKTGYKSPPGPASPSSSHRKSQSEIESTRFTKDHDHQNYIKLGKYIREKFHNQQICDVAFKVGDKLIPTHKIVLASQSPLFATLFEEKAFHYDAATPKIIKVRGVAEKSVLAFLEFLYSGTIEIEPTTISDLLKLSSAFKVHDIKKLCMNHITLASYEELLKILTIVKSIKEEDYCEKILSVIAKNFIKVKETSSFYELNKETLCLILEQDSLNTKSELDVFTSVISWIQHHDYEVTIQYFEELLFYVRFPLMSQKELFRCFKIFKPLRNYKKVVEMIAMANWIQTSQSLDQDDPLENQLPKERNGTASSPSVNSFIKTNSSTVMKEPPLEIQMCPMPDSMAHDLNMHARSSSSQDFAQVEKYEAPKSKTFTRRKVKDLKKENIRRTGRKIPKDSPIRQLSSLNF